ncbi:MAG: hypothetical protein BMS9Abin11_0316 [Gammaproteobacteria bacterium]|nr:MAG: hypothetical protein BMS9Abin11_0316 [Gammaproteobacteria bacterium]
MFYSHLSNRYWNQLNTQGLIRGSNGILLIIIAFFVMVDGYALADYFLYREWYQFDGNSTGWRYASATSFLLTLLVEASMAFAGIAAGSFMGNERRSMILRLLIVLMLGAMALTSLTA